MGEGGGEEEGKSGVMYGPEIANEIFFNIYVFHYILTIIKLLLNYHYLIKNIHKI